MRNIEQYGNELTITGVLVGNAKETEIIMFPSEVLYSPVVSTLYPTQEELLKIFNQMDTLAITNNAKVVLRKSQRQIDQDISWQVFRRDDFTCAYCGNNHTPMTVDHLILWENLGDSVPGNLLSACRKCNKTRGNQPLDEFLESYYYKTLPKHGYGLLKETILIMYEKAKQLPLRKERSR